MPPAVAADLWRALLLPGGLALAGLVFGNPLAGFAIGLVLLAGMQFRELWRMQRWLERKGEPPPRRPGLCGDVAGRIDRLQRQARKRKKRLRKVAERVQRAAEANPDGAIVLDTTTRIEWLNRAAARLLGLRQGQDHGQQLSNLVRKPDFAAWLARGDDTATFELDSPVNPDQRLLLRAVPYGGGKRMLLVRDITRLHALEQMRKDFVANVSHELRSPLTVLVGYLEGMADDDSLLESWRRPVHQMSQQAARMSRIVEDLLRLSRLESEPGGSTRQPVAVAELVDVILRDAGRISGVAHDVQVDVAPGLRLLGDYNELYSAFSNLVFNAVQYTPAGARIEIRFFRDGERALFQVRDAGVGIEAHHVPRLTERFYRVDKSRSREVGGTGLGLAIVKHVLMRHDALLTISSQPGEGSVFTCEFPDHRVELPSAARDPVPGQQQSA